MDAVALMMNSPRGRHFCANIGYACSNGDGSYRSLRRNVLDVLAKVDVRAIEQLPEIEILNALAYAVDCAQYWQPPDEEDIVFARPETVAVLKPIAETLLASAGASWWTEPVDLANQRLVQKFDSTRDVAELPLLIHPVDDGLQRWRERALAQEAKFVEYLIEDPNSHVGSEWWSIPLADRVYRTTRSRECVEAMDLMLEEDGFGWGHARIWPVQVQGTPRVYEITSPADWAHLVDTYPLAVPASRRSEWHYTTGQYHDWFIPDWTGVVADYDAVHLTMMGYLSTPGITIPLTKQPGATVLAGWDPDQTYWLNNDFLALGDMGIWCHSPDGSWAPA
ncbi:hypothetical protein [Rhodococcus sp. OK302]|uniref:hypothetical protein n=1 Tax=Rhodococcus sp. OK302 TaxID=1882769 RepID=UPI000B93AD58|nr:hypothetical protein [Rhodococcus sp. OK302]OYD70190.1 hypothetical protein BDB13_3787 [Rhodococcus sp. OK302]